MSDAVATIRVVGKDQASRELRKVQDSVGRVEKSAKRSKGVLDELLGGSRFGRLATLGGVAAGFGLISAKAIQAASNLEELTSKAQFVFGETFEEVSRRSNQVAEEMGRASSAILQMSADMGAVLDPMGLAKSQMSEMSVELSKLAVDMASFHNSTDQEAFIALRSAITGETEPMKRFGVVMTQANLAAFALSKGIKTKVQRLNQAQMTLLRYNYIMDATSAAQGDAERTADSFANQMRRLKGAAREVMEELAKPSLPKLSKALETTGDYLQNVFLPAVRTAAKSWKDLMAQLSGGQSSSTFKPLKGDASWGEIFGLVSGAGREITSYQRDLSFEDVQAAVEQGINTPMNEAAKSAGNLKKEIEELEGAGAGLGSGGSAEGAKKLSDSVSPFTAMEAVAWAGVGW